MPDASGSGVIYNPGEANSVTLLELIRKEAPARGFAVVEAAAPRSADVLAAAQRLVGEVDAIYVPTDNTVVTALEAIVRVGTDNKLPVFAGDTDWVPRGAIAAIGFNYYDLGRQTGKIVARVLKGESAGRHPGRRRPRSPSFTSIPARREAMGVEHPAGGGGARQARGRVGASATARAEAAAALGDESYRTPGGGRDRAGLRSGGLGVFLSFRVLGFPDLTVDGSFPLGAAVAATRSSPASIRGWRRSRHAGGRRSRGSSPRSSTCASSILHLLASILTMIALFSINLRVMGRPNVALISDPTVLDPVRGHGAAGLCSGRCSSWSSCWRGGAAGPLPDQRLRPRHAGDRRQPAHGAGARRLDRPHIYVGMALEQRAGRARRRSVRPDQRFRRHHQRHRHDRGRSGRGHRRRDDRAARRIGLVVLACVLGSILYRIAVASR